MHHPPKKAKIEGSSIQRRRASMDLVGMGGTFPEYGAIFMSNRKTMEECLRRKIFGLPFSKAGFVKNVKVGMVLFLFEYERRELHGVFQASTDGAIDIVPEAYSSSGKQFSAQVCVTTIWNCTPLTEEEFSDAIRDNYFAAKKFHFGLSEDQVHKLLILFSSKKLRQPQRHLRRSNVSEIVREDEVTNAPESGRFPRSDRVRNDHNMDNNVRNHAPESGRFPRSDRVRNDDNMDNNLRPVSTAECREKSLGKETRFYDHFSTEIPVNYLGDARLMMSNRERTRDHLVDDAGMAFPTKYYGNSLGGVRGVANVDRSQTAIDTEPIISTDYLYKPNLSRLEHSSRSGTPTIHYSGLYHGSDSVQESPFHPESRGVTRCFDITSGFRNCVSSPNPDDYECLRPRIPMPFSGPGYSESNAVEYSNPEGYRGLSFAGSSLLPVSLLEGENIGPATYSLRPIDETQHDFGYPEASHEKNKPLPRSGNSAAYAANVSLPNEVQCHSQGDLRSLEAESITFHENNMSDLDFQSRQKLRGMYSAREKSRNSVFSRLTFAAEASAEDNDSPVDYNELNIGTSVEELMTILHDSSYHWAKKWSNSKPLTGYDENEENLRRRKPKTVYSEMERDRDTLLLIQKNMDVTLDNGESNCETAKGQPPVHFKRRSEARKRKDEIKMGGLVESPGSNGMSGTCQKRRKLVRPNFSKNEASHEKKDVIGESTPNTELSSQPSHEKDVIGEITPNPELSSQESSFPEDNTWKSGTLDRNNENEKEEGPEQAGLLDPFQVRSGQNEALDRNHENDKEGPEQAVLPDVCQIDCEGIS